MAWWWSWLLTAVGVFGLWAAGSRKSWGWAVGLGAQGLWVAYALATDQYGFLVSAAAYGTVYARNFRRWRTAARAEATGPFSFICFLCQYRVTAHDWDTVLALGEAHRPAHPEVLNLADLTKTDPG